MSDNWQLEVKFQSRSVDLVGRLPAEKRTLLRDFPRRLVVSTKAKLSAVPPKGFFCKFFSKSAEELKMYMKKHDCALCVRFVASTYNFTLFLIVPVHVKELKCLHRLRKNGAPSDSIKSLCTDRDGVVIGFIVSEVNTELEERMHERQKGMQELASTVKAISNTFGDPMLEFDLLIDQLDTKPSAIQICSSFIIRHHSLHKRIQHKLCETMDAMGSSKGRANILFVVHDVIKSVRAGYPPDDRNAKMRESPLVVSLEKVLFQLVQKLPEDARHSTNVRAVLEFWTKWGLEYSKEIDDDDESAARSDVISRIDESIEMLEREAAAGTDASTSPVKPSTSPEVLAFMKDNNIQHGVWEVYLSRASGQEREELDAALKLNTAYFLLNNWDPSEKSGRRVGEHFLHQYVKANMPWLVHPSSSPSNNVKRKREKDALAILREAFLCTWDLDPSAVKAVADSDEACLNDMWIKMDNAKCQNASAFVFGKVRRMKTIEFAKSPLTDSILKMVEDESHVDTRKLVTEMVEVFKLDSMAREALGKVQSGSSLCSIAKEICHRCRHHMVANPSVHMMKLCQKAVAAENPMKAYSNLMKSMMSRQMKMAAMFDEKTHKKRKAENSSPSTESESSRSPHADFSDAEVMAVKHRIPKPPKLNFKRVDLNTITYQETNDNGTVGVAKSGIPNAGRGLFNLSSHAWPAFSVVCIFGVRRITKEMHHDGLTKVARCGELGETFVVVNGVVREVEKFQIQYGHRLAPFDGLVDADGSVGGFPNDRVYEYPANIYWDASSFYNNCILVPGCVIENPQDTTSPIVLDQLYIVTWKEVAVREEFFLAYGTSYYEDDAKCKSGRARAPSE